MNESHGYKRLKVGSVKKKEGNENQDEEMFPEKIPIKPADLIKKVESLKPTEAKAGMMSNPENVKEEL